MVLVHLDLYYDNSKEDQQKCRQKGLKYPYIIREDSNANLIMVTDVMLEQYGITEQMLNENSFNEFTVPNDNDNRPFADVIEDVFHVKTSNGSLMLAKFGIEPVKV